MIDDVAMAAVCAVESVGRVEQASCEDGEEEVEEGVCGRREECKDKKLLYGPSRTLK
jgi:hypothetical protein